MINWINTKDSMPLADVPVFLTKNPNATLKDSDIGHLISDGNGLVGWFTGDKDKILRIESRTFWIHLKEQELSIPASLDTPDMELEPLIEPFLNKLRLFDAKFMRLANAMMQSGNGLYHLDFYIAGILNRSLSLIYGFETLLQSSNFLSASHLVRPLLDNYLRLLAAYLVDNPHEFAKKIWEGEVVRKLKDKDGQKMSDDYLKKKATENYPWIENVYEETSGFIHFSAKHIKNATTLEKEGERQLLTYIGRYDNKVRNESKLEAIICTIEICNCISELVFGYTDTKRIKG